MISSCQQFLALFLFCSFLQYSQGSLTPQEYCKSCGGFVETRWPGFNTNNPESVLRLSGTRDFCKFNKTGDGSRLFIDVDTLFAELPTMATLSWYFPQTPGSSNPSSFYCSKIGGTDLFGGASGPGGGWILGDSFEHVLSLCVFSDYSAIDSWGLAYHANGITRGVELDQYLRWKPTK